MSAPPPVRARRRLLLGLVLLACMAPRLAFAPEPVGHHALDGSFYVHVAGHVAAGDGLATRVSLYHQGLRHLPHWSSIYPAWPLVLGASARVVGLDVTARLVPPLVALVALGLLYVLANRLVDAFGGRSGNRARRSGAWTAGHLAVLVLGLNPVFLVHTALPYADGLGFAFAFAALVALAAASERGSLAWAAAAGALGGLAVLARAQLAAVALAVPAALAIASLARPRLLAASLVAALAAAAAVAPWLAWLAARADPFVPAMLLDFTAYRETPELAPFPLTVATGSVADWMRDRAAGLLVAFDPRHPLSYFASFGAGVLLLPLALAVAAVRLARGAGAGREPGAGSRTARAVAAGATADAARCAVVLAVALAGIGSIAGVHALHATYIWEWWFHWRHGLPLVLLLTLSLAFVWATGPRWARLFAAGLVALAAGQGALEVVRLASQTRYAPGGAAAEERRLVEWIDSLPEPPTLLTSSPQVLAAWSARGRFHWMRCEDDPRQIERLLRLLPIDGIVVYPRDRGCAALAPLALPAAGRGAAPLFVAGALEVWPNPERR